MAGIRYGGCMCDVDSKNAPYAKARMLVGEVLCREIFSAAILDIPPDTMNSNPTKETQLRSNYTSDREDGKKRK